MMRAALVASFALVAVIVPGLALAQTQLGSISGVVVSVDGQPQPIPRAVVTITGGNIPDNLSAVSDSAGRFGFQNLAPGRYTIAVSKAAYLPMQYGATRSGRPGTSIALASAQNLELTIPLARGAVITGTVRDQFGAPVPGLQVTVSQAASVAGASGFRSSSDVLITDDRGMYRAFGLQPDEYVVSAVPRLAGAGEIVSLSRAEFDARMRALEQRHGGVVPAAVMPTQAASVDSSRPAGEPERLGFAPTFHPGTPIAANAARIRVAAGEERSGVDIVLGPVRAARVSGTIQGGGIPPERLRPNLTVMGPPQPSAMSPALQGPTADGTFTFTNVTPGRYTLLVRSGPGALMAFTDGRNGATTNNPDVAAMFATIDLDVDGNDVGGLSLILRPALSLSGRMQFEGTSKPPNPTSIRLSLTTGSPNSPSVLNGTPLGAGSPPATSALTDGTFNFAGVIPGTYGLTASATPGWRLRSAIVNGRDVLDDMLQIGGDSADIAGAVLTFTDTRSELAGTLTTASGQPANEFTVLVFPADRNYWRPGARRIKTARPASDGAFSILDLPAGEYLLAALTDVDPRDLQDAAFIDQIAGAAVKVTISDGQKTRQDLRIAR